MVVPFAAGGAFDVLARILAPHLSELLGRQVVVENVSGAGGMAGAYRVARAVPDGYQFVLGDTGTFAVNQALYKKPLYNPVLDFTPVALIAEQPVVLVVRKDLPTSNPPGFIAYAKVNQAKMQYGSAGVGSPAHLSCALLNATIGINVTHVPYRGAAPALQDVIAGQIDYMCTSAATAISQIESKSVRAIALLSKDRSPSLPTLASAGEQGLSGFEVGAWNALFLPRGTPAPIVGKLHDATVASMDDASIQQRLKQIAADLVAPERRSPEYLQKFVRREIEKWAGAIKASGISLD
jgi:tripartite-type tricarboxylate transporter receptor subunit TctC